MIVNICVHGGKFLQRFHLAKSLHSPLSSSKGKVRILNPIVEMPAHFAPINIAQFLHCSGVRSEAVGDDAFCFSVTFQSFLHEAQSRRFIPFLGDVAFEDLTFLINSPPEVNHLAIELHIHLIKMPFPMFEAAHPLDPLASNVSGEDRPKPVPPQTHGFVANVYPALEQQIFDVPQ